MSDGAEEFLLLAQDYRRAFSGIGGQKVLADLESRCFISETTTAQAKDQLGRIDPIQAAMFEGQRQSVLYIKGMIASAGELPPPEYAEGE